MQALHYSTTFIYFREDSIRAKFLYYHLENWTVLWSSRQSSWLRIQRSVFDSRHYQIIWEVVGLEQGPLRLVITTEELRSRKSSLRPSEIRHADYATPLYQQKLALTSETSGGRSVGIVRSRTKATELVSEGEWEASSAKCNFGNNSVFAIGPRITRKNVHRVVGHKTFRLQSELWTEVWEQLQR
jgi:hypothetical protein